MANGSGEQLIACTANPPSGDGWANAKTLVLSGRAVFWGALVMLASAGGLLSVGAKLPFAGVSAYSAAPWLSIAAFAIAIAGWRMLQREVAHRARGETDE